MIKLDALHSVLCSILLRGQEDSPSRIEGTFMLLPGAPFFECVAIFDYMKDIDAITVDEFNRFYTELEELSKMLFSLIKNLS